MANKWTVDPAHATLMFKEALGEIAITMAQLNESVTGVLATGAYAKPLDPDAASKMAADVQKFALLIARDAISLASSAGRIEALNTLMRDHGGADDDA